MSVAKQTLEQLEQNDDFTYRHIGPNDEELGEMLSILGLKSLDELVDKAIPPKIRSKTGLRMPGSRTENDVLNAIRKISQENKLFRSYIGMGYYNCVTPAVILRNILKDPAWYTAYTPYQPEISQGRLEALLNYQTMIIDLTGLEIANASLLDEGTAAAEAMIMCQGLRKKKDLGRNQFWAMRDTHPQTLEILATRAEPLGIELVFGDPSEFPDPTKCFGMLLSYPASSGKLEDFTALIARAHEAGILVTVAADLMSLTLLKSPGQMGADIAIGNSQRFGVPLGYGGPHAAFFATRDEYKRSIPGRLVGVSQDANGNKALRLALQTREQHIRREKATSNICTSQVLLAVTAGMYAVYHGPKELKKIATRIHQLTAILAEGLTRLGQQVCEGAFFDTLQVRPVGLDADQVHAAALAAGINFRKGETIGISLDETTTRQDLLDIWACFNRGQAVDMSVEELAETAAELPAELVREGEILSHPVFNHHHSETEMLRYTQHLAGKDLSLTHSMIPLGSCTMKLNATSEMIPISWPEFNQIHPFVPLDQAAGYSRLTRELEQMLCEITGFAGVSLQPNAGSQGEYAGLLTILNYYKSRGEGHRNVCLIPSSAHGTNPASAAMAGMPVVVIECDKNGNIDLEDLAKKAELHRERLAALMVTYPSTHGVFEEGITDLCEIVHRNGGQVYMDGANMNALVGLCKPGEFGPDVCHLNLHKTFCIPHGGGGPGVGPIGVAPHLVPHLPGHGQLKEAFPATASKAVSAAPYGSASILPISWTYIALMGGTGLRKATQAAILNANYIAKRLEDHYPVLYKGANGMVAHECILDLRPLKAKVGVEVDDIAKRLMDFGFHAPTMSWPVVGTLMIEPTESESKAELDRFVDAMIAIRQEIREVEEGQIALAESPLKFAPHTVADLVGEWNRKYSRSQGVFPLAWVAEHKFWPSVRRIDNAYGDKNLVCACPTLDSYR